MDTKPDRLDETVVKEQWNAPQLEEIGVVEETEAAYNASGSTDGPYTSYTS